MATHQHGAGEILLPQRERGTFTTIWIRVGIAVGCLLITTLVVWFGRDGYRDLDGTLNDFWSCLYYAAVSLSTTGYGDITPVTTTARLVNVFIITPLRFIFLITLIGTTIEQLSSRGRTQIRRQRWRERVSNHTVVVGFGVKGRSAVNTLLESGRDSKSIVVIAENSLECADAGRLGVVVVRGDARREDVLREAQLERAKEMIVAVNSDAVAVLITLTAHQVNKEVAITVAAREGSSASILREAGATSVIMTSESAGRLMAVTLLSPTAGGILEDLIDPSKGLEVVERPVRDDEIGTAPTALTEHGNLVLSIKRDGLNHRFDSLDITLLERGDTLVVIRHRPEGTS